MKAGTPVAKTTKASFIVSPKAPDHRTGDKPKAAGDILPAPYTRGERFPEGGQEGKFQKGCQHAVVAVEPLIGL